MADPRNSKYEGGSRWYTWPKTGEQFPSVTTILSVIDKPALKKWAAKTVAEYAVKEQGIWSQLDNPAAVDLLKGSPFRYTEKRSDLGTAVHESVERYILGLPRQEITSEECETCGQRFEFPWPQDIYPYMKSFEKFLDEWNPRFEASEASVYSRRYGYAGTLDMLVWIEDELILLDVKTGKEAYPEAAIQLTAYARADFMGLDDDSTEVPMPQVAGAGVLLLRPRHYKVIPVNLTEETFVTFRAARNLWYWQQEIAKTVFGKPMLPLPPGETA